MDRAEREREAPVWGIRPVPHEHRRFTGLDLAVLWGDLSIGLLVLVTGAQRWLVAGVGALGLGLALVFSMDRFELFLLLIGSVFVPLFGVFAAHYFVRMRGRYGEGVLFPAGGGGNGIDVRALIPWAAGSLLYQWSVPTGPVGWVKAMRTFFHVWLRLPFPLFDSVVGASILSFAAAFLLALVVLHARAPAET